MQHREIRYLTVFTPQIESVDVGPVALVTIGHDDSGPGAGWFLDEVQFELINLSIHLLIHSSIHSYSIMTKIFRVTNICETFTSVVCDMLWTVNGKNDILKIITFLFTISTKG